MISARPCLNRVELGEVLVDPHLVKGAEHGHAAGQLDVLGLCGDRGEHDGRGGDGEVGTVVLAEREHVEAEPVGQARVGDGVVEPIVGATGRPASRVGLQVAQGVTPISMSFMRRGSPACPGGGWSRARRAVGAGASG